MSIEAMNWAWQQAAKLTSSELLVLLAYADYASDDGTAWPKNATVGAKVNMDARSIRRHVSSLEAKGLLRRTINGFEGVKYPIPPDQRPNLVVLNTGGQDCPPVTESTRREDKAVRPREDKAVRPREDKAVHQNHHYEPPLEPPSTKPDSQTRRAPRKRTKVEEEAKQRGWTDQQLDAARTYVEQHPNVSYPKRYLAQILQSDPNSQPFIADLRRPVVPLFEASDSKADFAAALDAVRAVKASLSA